MQRLEWKESYTVGIRAFDEQHKILLSHLNKIIQLINDQSPKEQVNDLLAELDQYTRTHFKAEEEIFSKHKYYAAEQHNKEHRLFEGKIVEFQKKYESSYEKMDIELLEFLADWLMGHIQGSDKDYQKFLNNSGVF